MRGKLTVIIIVMVGVVLLCQSGLSLAKEALGESQNELTLAYTKFSFNLFGKLIEENKDQNIFISPLSTAFSLAIAYNGAAAETQQAIARTLEIQGMSSNALNEANALLRQALHVQDEQVILNLANSLWLSKEQKFNPEFLKINEEFYRAAAEVLNFHDPKAPSAINAWVAKETVGKISRIVDKIKPPLLLINTIHFKGSLDKSFPTKTKQRSVLSLCGMANASK